MRALVTGATGFIGRHLVSQLAASGYTVSALVRHRQRAIDALPSGVRHCLGDLEQPDTLQNVCVGIDTVFHLAGYAHAVDEGSAASAERHRLVTIDGTTALLDQARNAGVQRFIFVSSVKAMGESTQGSVDETTAPQPSTVYGRAKRAAELAVLAAGSSEMHACVLRLPMVYGPELRGNLPRMIAAVDRGWFPPLPELGNRRSMVHVSDVVQALMLVAVGARSNGQVYLVTDGAAYSTRELYDMIRAALGKPYSRLAIPLSALQFMAKLGDGIGRLRRKPFAFDSAALNKLIGTAWYRSEKIGSELGYQPRQALTMAIPEMVKRYRETIANR
ncbi:MAG: NAD-dependent epimerase/dehydratase family protein [Gammaproteobacteria bacterium]|nr:NAD-dependent epimerase/dehydratase family protein [Gammaproteobacteria bacterium]